MSLEAAIFDKDGVLVLTEGTYHRATRQAIINFGGDGSGYSWEDHKKIMGSTSVERVGIIKRRFNLTMTVHDFIDVFRQNYREIFEKEGLVIPGGVRELLASLKSNHIKRAVATGATRNTTDWQLERVGLLGEFDTIICADDVSFGKPHPESFLEAAKRLEVEAKSCVVFGDSINDVIAGKAAGMKVVAIVDPDYSRDPELAQPDLEVNSLKQVTIPLLKGLFI